MMSTNCELPETMNHLPSPQFSSSYQKSFISTASNDSAAVFSPAPANFDRKNEEEITLFEKQLTPSDVGKLNRLVIPKQQAAKHFPLDSDSDSGSGAVLGVEDEFGKSWRFRYSYWNSSQSYVLTRGWIRFVKEKRLQAGDVVVFTRRRGRLFIGWRRRTSPRLPVAALGSHHPFSIHAGRETHIQKQISSSSSAGSGSGSGSGIFKTLRLFGVDMECQTDPPPTTVSSRVQW